MMSALGQIGGRLYRGEVSFDFVGRRRLWYAISGLILVTGDRGRGAPALATVPGVCTEN